MSETTANPAATAITRRHSLATLFLRFYKGIVSPLLLGTLGPACRFEPTCSEYAAQAVHYHGFVRGSWMGLRRLLRCRPGGGWGYDPVIPSNSEELVGK